MQKCRLTITTVADGKETDFSADGEIEFSIEKILLRYRDGEAFVTLLFQGETAKIERAGDYTMSLDLKRGEERLGRLGIGGNEGEIATYTHKIAYAQGKDSLLASLHYDLLIGGEKQKMKLRILARVKA